MSTEQFYEDNKANWSDRAAVHADSAMYNLSAFEDPAYLGETVRYDAEQFGSIEGLSVAHLQCHVGSDTITLDRLGPASVVGVDFAPAAIEAARVLATRAGSAARFVEASVYDAPEAIGHTVDFVYTSVGTICWLHDIERWAAAVAGLLEPGGRFYIRDTHPTLFVFDEVDGEIVPTYKRSYSAQSPLSWDDATTYTDNPGGRTIEHSKHHEWNHSIADIVTALASNGMHIERMAEHDEIPWEFAPSCVQEGHYWYLPEPLRSQIPAMFSLHAIKQ